MRYAAILLIALWVSSCASGGKDYESARYCQRAGYSAGSAEYNQCVKEQQQAKMLEQQRHEYEGLKQQEADWRMRQAY